MLMPKCVVGYAGPEGLSGIYIKADECDRQGIKEFLKINFENEWQGACKKVKELYGNCFDSENDWPSGIDIYDWSEGLFVSLPSVMILYDKGEKSDTEFADIAIENTLRLLKKAYPDCSYSGQIAFIDTENNMIQKEVFSAEKDRRNRFDFIADVIESIAENPDVFYDAVTEQLRYEDTVDAWAIDMVDIFHLYEDKINPMSYNRLLEDLSEHICSDEIYDVFEEKINQFSAELSEKRSVSADSE
jgi:hypothetical protein